MSLPSPMPVSPTGTSSQVGAVCSSWARRRAPTGSGRQGCCAEWRRLGASQVVGAPGFSGRAPLRQTSLFPPISGLSSRDGQAWRRPCSQWPRGRASADGRFDMMHLDVPGRRGEAECTMRRGVWAGEVGEEMSADERRGAPLATAENDRHIRAGRAASRGGAIRPLLHRLQEGEIREPRRPRCLGDARRRDRRGGGGPPGGAMEPRFSRGEAAGQRRGECGWEPATS